MKDKIDKSLDAVQAMLDQKRLRDVCPNDVKPLLQRVRYLEAQVEHDKLIRDSYCRQLDAADHRVDELENALAGMLFAFDDVVGADFSKVVLDHSRNLVKAREFKS
jgi:hypothetical protein